MEPRVFVDAEFRLRQDTTAGWAEKDPVLARGEPGHNTSTRVLKVGDGVSRWSELDGYIPSSGIGAFVNEYLAESGSVEGVTQAVLDAHINSVTPHPIYDDGPSLSLLYENAKV